jgi:hypothetical protein
MKAYVLVPQEDIDLLEEARVALYSFYAANLGYFNLPHKITDVLALLQRIHNTKYRQAVDLAEPDLCKE